MADKIQALVGNNPMIKSVMSNPEHMAKAQEMLRNPEMQKQIGGVISNPAVIKQASEVLNGLQQMNTIQAGGRRRRRKRTRKKRRKSKKRKSRRKKRRKSRRKKRKKRTKKKRRKKSRRRRGGIGQGEYEDMPQGCKDFGQYHWLCLFQQGMPVPLETFKGNTEEIKKYCKMQQAANQRPSEYCENVQRKEEDK